MGKLHEVLCVESSLKTTAEKVIKEALVTFIDKKAHFIGWHKTYQPLMDGAIVRADEHKELDTTVADKLTYVFEHVVRALDATYQKEMTNTGAKADIVIDGNVIAKDVPATFLLSLESKLADVRAMFDALPTLDPGKKWSKDAQKNNTYVTDDQEVFSTEKVTEALVLYPATEKHPAQCDKIVRDKVVGKWITKQWCGAISVTDKSNLLGKTDSLLRAVKQARMRANNIDASDKTIAKSLADFLLG